MDPPWATQYILQLLDGLDEPLDPDLIFLQDSTDAVAVLSSAAGDLLARINLVTISIQLDSLILLSVQQLTNASARINARSWRRLHTDTSILRSFVNLAIHSAKHAIQLLDQAIIISGAADFLRLDMIHEVIRKIQHSFCPECVPFQPSELSPPPLVVGASTFSSIPSPRYPPSLNAFQSTFYKRPFLLRGYARHWPACTDHPWRSSRYLRAVAGPCRSVPVEVGKDYLSDDWSQRFVDWDEFLDTLDFGDQTQQRASTEILYLAQHSLFMQFPALQSDIIIPDYAYAYIEPADLRCYEPPENPERMVCNAWLGPKGTISPAHTDPFMNLFVQVVGRKTVWIAPPTVTKYMQPHSDESSVSKPASSTSLTNTSQMDVFSTENMENHDDFMKEVVPVAQTTILLPGDLLYLPPGWWHAMRSEETSFSLSIWF